MATTDERAAGIGDEAVKAKTGKTWAEWFAIMDAGGMKGKSHRDIVKFLSEQHGIGPWWRQMMTVQYEQARGQRVKFQSCDGVFQASSSKTVNAPIERVFDALNDEKIRRQWLPNALTIRKSTSPKSLRITWEHGTTWVDVNLFAKGDAKCSVNVEHSKLSGAEEVPVRKAFWAQALNDLKAFIEA